MTRTQAAKRPRLAAAALLVGRDFDIPYRGGFAIDGTGT